MFNHKEKRRLCAKWPTLRDKCIFTRKRRKLKIVVNARLGLAIFLFDEMVQNATTLSVTSPPVGRCFQKMNAVESSVERKRTKFPRRERETKKRKKEKNDERRWKDRSNRRTFDTWLGTFENRNETSPAKDVSCPQDQSPTREGGNEREMLTGEEKHAKQEENTEEDACRVGKREGQKKKKANKGDRWKRSHSERDDRGQRERERERVNRL